VRHAFVLRVNEEKAEARMQGQGVLFGQVGVVFGIVIAGVWTATQWTAAALG
jgi:type IV secretion system protein VirD4